MNDLEKKKSILGKIKPDLKKQYGVIKIGFFGSYVRGEYGTNSDLDILVTLDGTIGLLKFIELENYLAQIFKVPVDLVIEENLRPHVSNNILKEVIYI